MSGATCGAGSMAKIYTRVGDGGETALFGGGRVRKDDVRMEAIGTVDELNAAVGVVRMELLRGNVPPGFDDLLSQIQHRLFDLGAELATPEPAGSRHVSNPRRARGGARRRRLIDMTAGSNRCGHSSCPAAVPRRHSSTWRAAFAGGPNGGW